MPIKLDGMSEVTRNMEQLKRALNGAFTGISFDPQKPEDVEPHDRGARLGSFLKGADSNRTRLSSTATETVLWNFGCLDLVVHRFDVLRQEPALGHKLREASIDPRGIVFLIFVEFFENRFRKPDLCTCNLA